MKKNVGCFVLAALACLVWGHSKGAALYCAGVLFADKIDLQALGFCVELVVRLDSSWHIHVS